MKTDSLDIEKTSLAALVAHEDLRIGDFVGVLYEIVEYPSFFWCDPVSSDLEKMVRIRCYAEEGGTPLKIKAICLPFVYVKSPEGSSQTIDVRQVQLVRLDKRYSKTVWKDLRKKRSKNKDED